MVVLSPFTSLLTAQEAKEQEWLDLFKAAGLGRLQTAAKLIKTGVNMNRQDKVCDHHSIHQLAI